MQASFKRLQTILTSSLPREDNVVSEEFQGEIKPIFTLIVLLSALPEIKNILQKGSIFDIEPISQ